MSCAAVLHCSLRLLELLVITLFVRCLKLYFEAACVILLSGMLTRHYASSNFIGFNSPQLPRKPAGATV
jgi:hypothetical protein